MCDNCHSQGGAFDGVAMAQANWDAGIYETNGTALKSGNEKWCASCHDDEPANSKKDDTGVNAPNIIGDNTSYGFYVTGHKVSCTNCHDASKNHIDDEHRTYESSLDNYQAGYRLRSVDGGESMRLPRPKRTDIYAYLEDFALCFDCHNPYAVMGEYLTDVSQTNFWPNDGSHQNGHNFHLGIQTLHFDSDWDGTADSRESCIACHDVHGSPTNPMIRHGELISTYDTTDKVPALDFCYLVPSTGPWATATWTPNIPEAGDYDVYAWWKEATDRATNAKFTVYHDGGSQTIEVNQKENGTQWYPLGSFPFAAGTSGYVELSNEGAESIHAYGYVMADAIGWDSNLDGIPDIIIDNDDPEFGYVGAWTYKSGVSGAYGDDQRYHAIPGGIPDPDATLGISVGGQMDFSGRQTIPGNGVCNSCHNVALSYLRDPYPRPKVINAEADPGTVLNDGSGTTVITASVSDPDGNFSNDIEVDLTSIDESLGIEAMYDDGTHGDAEADDGIYSYEVTTIPAGTSEGAKTLVITATDTDSYTGAGRVQLLVGEPGAIYVDNLDLGFSLTVDPDDPADVWTRKTMSGAYPDDGTGTVYQNSAGDGSSRATWTPDIPEAGNYEVYACWTTHSNRATDAPYTIYYDGGSQTVDVNQEINGGQWNLLGTFSFAAGTSGYIVLSDDANENVIADAVKLKPQP